MLQYTFIFDTIRIEMPFTFIIILFVFLFHPIKIYHLSRSATPFLPHHLLFPTLFSSPICSFLLHTAIFLSPILPSTSFLPSLIYKNQVYRFFFPFFPFFFAFSFLFYDLIYRIRSSSQSCRFAVQSEPPPIYSLPSHKFHHQLTIKSPSLVIFPPFLPFFFSLFPLCFMISHTESV